MLSRDSHVIYAGGCTCQIGQVDLRISRSIFALKSHCLLAPRAHPLNENVRLILWQCFIFVVQLRFRLHVLFNKRDKTSDVPFLCVICTVITLLSVNRFSKCIYSLLGSRVIKIMYIAFRIHIIFRGLYDHQLVRQLPLITFMCTSRAWLHLKSKLHTTEHLCSQWKTLLQGN